MDQANIKSKKTRMSKVNILSFLGILVVNKFHTHTYNWIGDQQEKDCLKRQGTILGRGVQLISIAFMAIILQSWATLYTGIYDLERKSSWALWGYL